MAKSILNKMEKIVKKLNKKYLAVFLPLAVLSFISGGVTPLWTLSILAGVGYILWQVSHA